MTIKLRPFDAAASLDNQETIAAYISDALASQHRVADLLGTSEQTVALWEKRGKIPKTADRMLRAIYLETIDGKVKLKELIERAADLDRKSDEKMIFQDTESGWLPQAA